MGFLLWLLEEAEPPEQLVFGAELKYPGLMEILEDPYGSLYLHDGMCQEAVRFLEERLAQSGAMEIAALYGEYDLEGKLIRSALGHLLVTCDVSRLDLFVEGLSARGVINGMDDVPGWDARLLNEEMLEMVRREYPQTAERIATKSYYKWQEEHKKALSVLGQIATEIAYGCMSYECMIAARPYTGAVESRKTFTEAEKTTNENGETGGGGNEGGIKRINPNEIRYSQSSVNDSNEIINSMKQNGWKGAPTTWGEAIELRIGKQTASFRNANLFGSLEMESIK